jgi:hypothetical protein
LAEGFRGRDVARCLLLQLCNVRDDGGGEQFLRAPAEPAGWSSGEMGVGAVAESGVRVSAAT